MRPGIISFSSVTNAGKFPPATISCVLRIVPKKQANPIDAQVGNRVRIRRMLIGMSQEKLGDLLGLTFQQVQKYEKGVNRIGAGRLYEVSRILGVPIDFFYEGVAAVPEPAGFAESRSAPPVMEFVSSGEGLQLSLAFMKIKDPKVRKRVLDLVKSLAEEEAGEVSWSVGPESWVAGASAGFPSAARPIKTAWLFRPGPTGLRVSSARHRHRPA